MTNLYLGQLKLIPPNQFTPEPYRVVRENEMADGTLKFDVITIKHRFYLAWDYLEEGDYTALKALYDANSTFNFIYPAGGGQLTKTVWIAVLNPGVMVGVSPELYEGVSAELVEI